MRVLLWATLVLALACDGAAAQPVYPAKLAASSTLVLTRPWLQTPLRGFSSVNARPDGTYWVLADSGHAMNDYHPEAQIVFHHVFIDWVSGKSNLLSAQALRDPDRRLPFAIANEHTSERILTRADANVDAMQVIDWDFWLADDLGPWLLHANQEGRVLGLYELQLEGRPLKAGAAGGGFGGLAASRDGRMLYAALERALPDEPEFARIFEFDRHARRWTGRVIHYPLERAGHTIADLALIDLTSALVVERGTRYRRVHKVALEAGAAVKQGSIDLRALQLGTVEGIDVMDPGYIVLSSGDRPDFVLLRSPEMLSSH
jgi:hypothetical protein